jgi:hypothetical protein
MAKIRHLGHPFRAAALAKKLLSSRINMWSFATHGARRFRNDSRFDLENVTEGFRPRIDDSNDDTELLERICVAYIKTVKQLQPPPEIYGPTDQREQVRTRSLGPAIKALLTQDIVTLRKMYRNFFRDPCSAGLLGVPYGMSKAYFGGAIRDAHRRFYLSHALYRIDYWMAQTEGRFALSDLAGPLVGNPFGVAIDQAFVRVGADYAHYCAYRVGRLLNSEVASVAEVGGGFGGIAYYLLRDRPKTTYLNFDTPESIALASYYLLKSFPQLKAIFYDEEKLTKQTIAQTQIVLMPISQLATMPPNSIDVSFGSHAMSGISPEIIDEYLNNLTRMTRSDFLYIGNRSTTKSISNLVSRKHRSLKLVETRSSGWHSHKISGAGVGGAAGLAASIMFEQHYKHSDALRIEQVESCDHVHLNAGMTK